MGRPLNSKFFGPGVDKLSIAFNNGTETVSGFIVKQLGTSSYRVSDGTDEYDVILNGNITTVSDLQPGEAAISALDKDGEPKFVSKLFSATFTTADGEIIAWNQEPLEGESLGSIITIGEFVIPVEPEVLTAPDATVIGELGTTQMLNTTTKELFFGVGNLGTNYVVSRNPRNGIELGLKIHKRGDDTAQGVVNLEENTVTYQIPAEEFVVENEVRRVSWVINYAIAAETPLNDFDIELDVNLDPTGVQPAVKAVRSTGNSWSISGTQILAIDSVLSSSVADSTKIDQNATNIGYEVFDAFRPEGISATWDVDGGEFPITLRAIKDGVTVAEVSVVVITNETNSWVIG